MTTNSMTHAPNAAERTNAEARALLENLRKEITTALEAVLETNPGLALKLGTITYDTDGAFRCKLEGTLPGGSSKDEQAYARLARIEAQGRMIPGPDLKTDKKTGLQFRPYIQTSGRQLPPLGSKFTEQGRTFKILGATKGGRVIVEESTGKKYTFPVDAIVGMTSARGAK